MIRLNDVVEELVDDVFIRGIGPSSPFKPMTDNELTIEELKSVSGGFSHNPEWLTGAPWHPGPEWLTRANQNQRRVVIHPDLIIDPIHKVGLRGNGDAVERAVAVPAFL